MRTAPGVPIVSQPDLVGLAALLTTAGAYVGNDSGVTHLAAAVGAPVVALFGPTDVDVWGPRGRNVSIIRAAKRTTQSLAEVEVDTVMQAVLAGLASTHR
jgi:ADP-heptose:LPS heptosyltransferase